MRIARIKRPAVRFLAVAVCAPLAMLALLAVSALAGVAYVAELAMREIVALMSDAWMIAVEAIEEIRISWIGEATPRVGRGASRTWAGDDRA